MASVRWEVTSEQHVSGSSGRSDTFQFCGTNSVWLPRSHVGWERRGTSEVKADSLWAALILFPAHLLLTHSAKSQRVIPGPLAWGPKGSASSEGLLVPPLFPGKWGELPEGTG